MAGCITLTAGDPAHGRDACCLYGRMQCACSCGPLLCSRVAALLSWGRAGGARAGLGA